MNERSWPGEWMRGILSLGVLAVVAEQETYGYAIAQRLRLAGLGTVKGGTLYPILTRLEQDGLVASQWREGEAGPGRKFFRITDQGATALASQAEGWRAFNGAINSLLPPREDKHDDSG